MTIWLERILGIVFLASAVLKALDMNAFAVQSTAYHVLEDMSAIQSVSWVVLAVEALLGIALLVSFRPRWVTHGGTLGLLAVFTALIGYAWAFHDLEDCGCLGKYVTMGPGLSLTKNAVMMLMSAIAWIKAPEEAATEAARKPRWALAALAAAAVLSAGFYGEISKETGKTGSEQVSADAPFSRFVFESGGETYDLGQGEYFVAFFSATCDHCQSQAPELNEFTLFPELPRVVALMLGGEEEIEEFDLITAPEYLLEPIDELVFFDFLVGKAPPSYYYIRDGVSIHSWDEDAPTIEELQRVVMGE